MNRNTTDCSNSDTAEITIEIPQGSLPLPRSSAIPEATNKIHTPRKIWGSGFFRKFFYLNRKILVDQELSTALPANDDIIRSDFSAVSLVKQHNIFEHYAVEERPFASGGQGYLSQATDLSLGCRTAVKSLHKKYCSNAEAKNAFLREARLTAGLDHPAIIPIHGLYCDPENGMHLAMKMIHGQTLSRYLKSIVEIYQQKGIHRYNERESLFNRLEIFLKVCDAVAYAHDRNIIHRDLKPENIMLGQYGETYVTDWGIAMHVQDAEYLQKVSGTPGFIAPETVSEKRSDFRSDIYSLGLILFELVTLKPAFRDEKLPVLLEQIKCGSLEPVKHRFHCRIDSDLIAIIKRATALAPTDRYQQVQQLADDLRRYIANEEVQANPDNLFERIARWSVNHRRGMLLTTLFLLLATIGSSSYSWHKEYIVSIEKRKHDQAVGAICSHVVNTVHDMEKTILQVSSDLHALQMYMRFADALQLPENPDIPNIFIPAADYRNHPPESFTFAESYGHKTDLENVAFFNTLDRNVSQKRLQQLAPAAAYMRKIFIQLNPEMQPDNSDKNVPPVSSLLRMVCISTADGLFAFYPGTDIFPANYSPAERIWYTQAVQNPGRSVWSPPYMDIANQEMVTTCALAVWDDKNKFIGVAAIDFSLTGMSKKFFHSGEKYNRFAYEKMLINPQGEIIFRMQPQERKFSTVFNDRELIKRMQLMRSGTLHTFVDNRDALLVFAAVKPLGVLFVELLDLKDLVDYENARNLSAENTSPQ